MSDIVEENLRLRAALANSDSPCVYCSLPAADFAKCKSGFPGCARADDMTGCPEFGAALELHYRDEQLAERDATIRDLQAKIQDLEKGLEDMIALSGFASFHGVGMRINDEWVNASDVIKRARDLLPPPPVPDEGK